MEMPKEAKGGDGPERRKLAPAKETQPIPAARGARERREPTSIAGMWKLLAAAHHDIVSLTRCFLERIWQSSLSRE